jgi:hypothetical protein
MCNIYFSLPLYDIISHYLLTSESINLLSMILFRCTFFFFLFFYCAGWGYTVAFTKVLTVYQIYHTWIYLLHHSPLSPFPTIPGIVSKGIIFPFIYICTQYLHYIHPSTPFPYLFPPPTGTNSPGRACSPIL